MKRSLSIVALSALLSLAGPSGWAQDDALGRARTALAVSNYALAEKELATIPEGGRNLEARVIETRLLLWTGRYADAVKAAERGARLGAEAKRQLAPWRAEALARQGKVDDAVRVVREVEGDAEAHRARLVLGELLIKSGKRTEAETPLRDIIQARNDDVIKDDDPEGMSLVGRAAHLLRQYKMANQAYDLAERAGAKRRVESLLWRAELFLEKYNPGTAGTVVKEALKLAPEDPRVRVMVAHVKLENALDFEGAEQQIAAALKVDPSLAAAYFVRAGLALRDMDIEAADRALDAGLKVNPVDLDLLSMKAATRFLAEDRAGFDALEQKVLGLNPQYSRFYSVVAEYAEWEHRYDEIVSMMKKAVQIDDKDSKAHAQLGVNLIRNGQDDEGLESLRRAEKRDKYSPYVFNTLNLYENTIAKEYVTVDGTRFRIRYHKDEKAILERYVPKMLDQAWGAMVKRYGFTPQTPVGIELYADSDHFSIRTSGLPNVGIQGVCFGKTLAALSPGAGSFNWGMILWHELAHVFHIQMSKSRVPRWYTEGLAEYETIIQRPEWQREEHLALFEGLRGGKIPKVASFNSAFTHVDSAEDVVMAYFAASQIHVFLDEAFGVEKVVRMMPLWADGKRTPEVVQQALGVSVDELDERYKAWLRPRLARYSSQFVPDLRPPASLEDARKAVADDPQSASKLVKLALALMQEGDVQAAQATLQLALKHDPKEPNALYLQMRLLMSSHDAQGAERIAKQLVEGGHDGYGVRMKLADLAEEKNDVEAMRSHLYKAHRLDPTQAEPIQALYDLANKQNDTQTQLWALRELSKLDQHDRRVWHRLLEMLVERGQWDEARRVGESAIYVDVGNPEVHWLYARALARSGQQVSAIFELNSAILAGAAPAEAAKIYRAMAAGYTKLKRPEHAKKAEEYAKFMEQLPPKSAAPAPEEHEHD
jgi:tetratricopeptide (TPR) repeat protein